MGMIQHINKEDLGRRRRRSASNAVKTETFATVINGYTRNTELKRAIWNFVSYRRDQKAPLSLNLLKITLRKLSEISCDERDAIDRIETAIENGWMVPDGFVSIESKNYDDWIL